MKAYKDNRVYTITEADVESFRKEGYDVYDDEGDLVAYGAGKAVAYEQFEKVQEMYEATLEENGSLMDKVAKLEAEVASLKKQLTEAEGKPTKKDSKK